jgi:Saxitoxin biosynthesis operon protein SxtJ
MLPAITSNGSAMAHEDLTREENVEGSSDRAFGLVFAVVFLLIGSWPLIRGQAPHWWGVVVSATFGAIALLNPALLATLNRLWLKLGILLGRIISPIALGILFYCVLTPVGVVMRLMGKDPLCLKRDADADTYWILREPPGPPPDSMTNQF